jgi:hypothetical protein
MEYSQEQVNKLIQLIESGSQNWTEIQEVEMIFFGEKSGCRCKTGPVLSRLNQIYNQLKK